MMLMLQGKIAVPGRSSVQMMIPDDFEFDEDEVESTSIAAKKRSAS